MRTRHQSVLCGWAWLYRSKYTLFFDHLPNTRAHALEFISTSHAHMRSHMHTHAHTTAPVYTVVQSDSILFTASSPSSARIRACEGQKQLCRAWPQQERVWVKQMCQPPQVLLLRTCAPHGSTDRQAVVYTTLIEHNWWTTLWVFKLGSTHAYGIISFHGPAIT